MKNTLYSKQFEHDACGIGAVVSIDGKRSHKVVSDALTIVEKLQHRAGTDATGEIGDGVGILVQISHNFFKNCGLSFEIGEERDYGVGMFFFPTDDFSRKKLQTEFENICAENNTEFLGWRTVPVRSDILGKIAFDSQPTMMQAFIKRPENTKQGIDFDRLLYVIRREFEHLTSDAYVPSLSSRTIVYKGLLMVEQLREFYLDLKDESYTSAIAMVHSRFSTNTNPSWERAHPNRVILHNGEINTIGGNADRMFSRESSMKSSFLTENSDKIFPVINGDGSDSAMLDNTLEFLYMNDLDLPLAVMLAIPEPWQNNPIMTEEKAAFYQYNATMMEPWDGPAAILFSDGDIMGATLDRNGLRPSRYYITSNNTLILSSEVGVLDIPADKIVKKSRLEPGKILLVDTVAGKIISDDECKKMYASQKPYANWLKNNMLNLDDLTSENTGLICHDDAFRSRLYKAFNYNHHDVREKILKMAETAVEPTASMGSDIPLAPLSNKHQPLFKYFKQLFAQVTNPPIDSLREKIVTDTAVYIGTEGNILSRDEQNCAVLKVKNPILTANEFNKIINIDKAGFRTEVISTIFDKNISLEIAMDNLFCSVENACKNGVNIVVLSDRGVNENNVAIPSLLAVSGVCKHLDIIKKRTAVSVVLESAEPRDVHQFAMLLGYGAKAVFPYLAHECIAELINKEILAKDLETAVSNYNHAIIYGIVKVSAKMGISCIQSYQSAQIFEAIGLNQNFIDKYFTKTYTPVSGVGIEHIENSTKFHHDNAFITDDMSDSIGFDKMRPKENEEDHLYNPKSMKMLQFAVRDGDYDKYKEYSKMINQEHQPHTLRALMDFDFSNPISIDQVEPVSSIVKRFKTGAMSYGSISIEAHECIAEAMNILGGKSNSGEGGERPERLNGPKNSAIKQVASGRFGVTSEYLLSAKEIQIKMAQGAKPGEGGHLPGKKVYPWIAKTRLSTPGVNLISPPPHHDIYSIEDLAQLIYDLKNANERARISVKLVSEAGVGTIASGVAKSGASVILISGFDGGTGAAPQSSIHDTGLPWELGVAEAHQTLIANKLRSSITLEADGKMMTGRDVAIAALLGAEEFGFATTPLIVMGCMMMRVCHTDTCPFGIATQNEKLRARFKGKPEHIINFMNFVAEELREIMAGLGFKTVDEMVGSSYKLKAKNDAEFNKFSYMNLDPILAYTGEDNTIFKPENIFNYKLEQTLDHSFLITKFEKALKTGEKHTETTEIHSMNRTFGTIFGSKITDNFGTSLADDTFTVNCHGGAGQSFGAFIPKGLTLNLIGDANDYIGKGLSGGKITLSAPKNSTFKSSENIIVGNVALFGATSGKAFLSGIAGERFMVRNSGAIGVCEGVGDHGLEYMTGGIAVILGETGKNFASGMSGGVAYVFDKNDTLNRMANHELITIYSDLDNASILELKSLITEHFEATDSQLAKEILDNFEENLPKFKKIIPNDYKNMLDKIAEFESQGMSYDDAAMSAFTDSLN